MLLIKTVMLSLPWSVLVHLIRRPVGLCSSKIETVPSSESPRLRALTKGPSAMLLNWMQTSHIKDPTTSNGISSSTMCHINRIIWSCCKIEDTIVRCAHSSQFGTIIPKRCLRNFEVVKSESVTSLCSGCKGETDSDPTASVEAKVDILLAAIDVVKTDSD
ncbi:unnamed protein product [Zymoseptoria tritici ST99CH_3D1]|nr:unnamed protein product [Zymoseptoria tritici ST99CH_3D1]